MIFHPINMFFETLVYKVGFIWRDGGKWDWSNRRENTGTGGALPHAIGQCVVHSAPWFTQGPDDIIKVCFGIPTPGSVGRIYFSSDEWEMISRGTHEKGSLNACLAIWWLLPAVKWESIWDTGLALPRVSQLFSPFWVTDIGSVICHCNSSRAIQSHVRVIWRHKDLVTPTSLSLVKGTLLGAIKETVKVAWGEFWQEFKPL